MAKVNSSPDLLTLYRERKYVDLIIAIFGAKTHSAIQNSSNKLIFVFYIIVSIIIVYAVYLGYISAKTEQEANSLLGAYFSLLFLHVVIAGLAPMDSIWIFFIHLIILAWFLCSIFRASIKAGTIALITWIVFGVLFVLYGF